MTKPARAAGLVEEHQPGEATQLAAVRVFAFEHLFLVVDRAAVSTEHITELVLAAAQATNSIYRAIDTSVQVAGNGYQLQLPPAADAGFQNGDAAPCRSTHGILVIAHEDNATPGADSTDLTADLIAIRDKQLN